MSKLRREGVAPCTARCLLKLGILLLGLGGFVALQLSASVLAGQSGLGSQAPVRCADCGATGFYVDGACHPWHLLRTRTYHVEREAAAACEHAWVHDENGTWSIACGALPLAIVALVQASLGMAALSLAVILWLFIGLVARRAPRPPDQPT